MRCGRCGTGPVSHVCAASGADLGACPLIAALITVLISLSPAADAADGQWRDPRPYARPVLNVSGISVNGNFFAVASGGAVGGVFVKYKDKPHWLSHTRALALGSYGLTSGSLGADGRVGSFIGPDGKVFRVQVGPDVWFNGYGDVNAVDYHLPWSPGVDLSTVTTLKIVKELHLVGEATPGWAFLPDRQQGGLGPFHELTLAASMVVRTDLVRLTLGYRRRWTNFGMFEGIILSGAL